MCDKFKTDGKYAYVKEVLSWLKLEETFSEDNFLDEKVNLVNERELLTNYIDSIVGKKLYSDEQQKLSDMILKQLLTIGKNIDCRTKKIKHTTLGSIISDELNLDYVIVSGVTSTYIDGKRKRNRYIQINKH